MHGRLPRCQSVDGRQGCAAPAYAQPVEHRSLGRTGLVVSRVGLGLAALGRPGYVNLGHAADLGADRSVAALERRTHRVLDAARAGRVRYLDVARSYGLAERFLASWLATRGVPAAEVTIGTKWGYTYTADWRVEADVHEVKDHSLATLRRQWAESRELLGGRIGLLQVHSATDESGILDDRAVHRALVELRRDGEVRAIGMSLSGPRQAGVLRRAREIEVEGERLLDAVQVTWNALEPSAGAALAEAHGEGIGVIVKEALANGRLVRGPEAALLRPHAERLGATLDGVALAHVLAQPWADVVLSGAASAEQLRSNLAAAAVELDDAARAQLRALAEPPETYWRERAGLAWT